MITHFILKSFTSQGWSKSGCHFDPIKWQDKSPKKGVKKALFTAKKPQVIFVVTVGSISLIYPLRSAGEARVA
jgi:hypothetical protein